MQMMWHVGADSEPVQLWFRAAYRSYIVDLVRQIDGNEPAIAARALFPVGAPIGYRSQAIA